MSLPADTVLLSSLFPSCLCPILSGFYVQALAMERAAETRSTQWLPNTAVPTCIVELLGPARFRKRKGWLNSSCCPFPCSWIWHICLLASVCTWEGAPIYWLPAAAAAKSLLNTKWIFLLFMFFFLFYTVSDTIKYCLGNYLLFKGNFYIKKK